jgi:sulfur relay (sulfurtransferase) complex TusBCD TusD component (DsrE family)
MKTLFVINDPPYGTERVYNARRRDQTVNERSG